MEIPNHTATLPAMLRHLGNVHGSRVLASNASRSLSYRQAEEESRELALGLLAAGVGKGTRVGLLMPNSPDWIVAWFAALRVGALVTGVSTFCKPPELARVLKLADIDTLLMQDGYLRHNYVTNMEHAFPGLASARGGPLRLAGAPYLRSVWVWGGAKPAWARGDPADLRALGCNAPGLSGEFLAEVESEVSPADLAVVIFTSGSTAEPKGVVHSHGTVVRHAYTLFDYAECAPGTRILVLTPFFWIGGMLTTLLNTMIGGAELICPERPNPEFILELLRRELPDQITGWAGQLTAIREHPDFRPDDFLRLQASHNTQRRAGVVGPPPEMRLPLVPNSLGMSESFGPHSGELDGVVLSEDRADSFGRAIDGIERKIVSPGGSAELPPGETGELLIRGYSIMQGYYKRERGECFEPDGFFRTGDLCAITARRSPVLPRPRRRDDQDQRRQCLAARGGTRAHGAPGSRRGRGARQTGPARRANRRGRGGAPARRAPGPRTAAPAPGRGTVELQDPQAVRHRPARRGPAPHRQRQGAETRTAGNDRSPARGEDARQHRMNGTPACRGSSKAPAVAEASRPQAVCHEDLLSSARWT